MTFAVNHVHLKTRDPKRTMQFYIDNFGATFVAEIGRRDCRVNLHGLTLSITTTVDGQTREQHHGIEHVALATDDYPGTLARLRANGVRNCGIGSCGVPRPSLAGYVAGTGARSGAPAARGC